MNPCFPNRLFFFLILIDMVFITTLKWMHMMFPSLEGSSLSSSIENLSICPGLAPVQGSVQKSTPLPNRSTDSSQGQAHDLSLYFFTHLFIS